MPWQTYALAGSLVAIVVLILLPGGVIHNNGTAVLQVSPSFGYKEGNGTGAVLNKSYFASSALVFGIMIKAVLAREIVDNKITNTTMWDAYLNKTYGNTTTHPGIASVLLVGVSDSRMNSSGNYSVDGVSDSLSFGPEMVGIIQYFSVAMRYENGTLLFPFTSDALNATVYSWLDFTDTVSWIANAMVNSTQLVIQGGKTSTIIFVDVQADSMTDLLAHHASIDMNIDGTNYALPD